MAGGNESFGADEKGPIPPLPGRSCPISFVRYTGGVVTQRQKRVFGPVGARESSPGQRSEATAALGPRQSRYGPSPPPTDNARLKPCSQRGGEGNGE
jgi:hypothetical protein